MIFVNVFIQTPSPSTIESMDLTDDISEPIIQSVDLNNALSTRFNPNDRVSFSLLLFLPSPFIF